MRLESLLINECFVCHDVCLSGIALFISQILLGI